MAGDVKACMFFLERRDPEAWGRGRSRGVQHEERRSGVLVVPQGTTVAEFAAQHRASAALESSPVAPAVLEPAVALAAAAGAVVEVPVPRRVRSRELELLSSP